MLVFENDLSVRWDRQWEASYVDFLWNFVDWCFYMSGILVAEQFSGHSHLLIPCVIAFLFYGEA